MAGTKRARVKAAQAVKPEKTAEAATPGKAAREEKPGKTEKPEKGAKAVGPGKAVKMRKAAKTGKAEKDGSTEEKIKEAARKLFTKNGFAATRTRDIAEEAGINLALLNYYFRSKQKLFDLIMMDNFSQFIQALSVNIFDEKTTMAEKIDRVASDYIDFLTAHPDLPLFILNEIRGNPLKIAARINDEVAPLRSHFFKQLRQASEEGQIGSIDPFHFIANLVGLTVFPFVGKPILQRVTGSDDSQFADFMQERKKLIPLWIRAMLTVKNNPVV